jgi:hypothetical protein
MAFTSIHMRHPLFLELLEAIRECCDALADVHGLIGDAVENSRMSGLSESIRNDTALVNIS